MPPEEQVIYMVALSHVKLQILFLALREVFYQKARTAILRFKADCICVIVVLIKRLPWSILDSFIQPIDQFLYVHHYDKIMTQTAIGTPEMASAQGKCSNRPTQNPIKAMVKARKIRD